jgi:hypothetical protein
MKFSLYLNEWKVIGITDADMSSGFEKQDDILFFYYKDSGLWWARKGIAYHNDKQLGKLKKTKLDARYKQLTGSSYIYSHESLKGFIEDTGLYVAGRIKQKTIILYEPKNPLSKSALDAVYKYITEE